MYRSLPWAARLAGGAVLLVLCAYWSSKITGDVIEKDGDENLRLAFNLVHHGVASLDEQAPYRPSMYREPLPIVPIAAAIAMIDAALGPGTIADYESGPRAALVKEQNLFWAVLLVVATYWAAYLFTASRLWSALAALLVSFDPLPLVPSGVSALGLDVLFTDLAAAALLMIASALLVSAWRSRTPRRFALAGAAIGLLALVKAVFLYGFVGLVAALAVLEAVERADWRRALTRLAALVAAFAVVVLPWMLRNYAELGRFQLTERGGLVLMVRALQNDMTAEEYRGAIYLWAPDALRPVLGRALGFSRHDLERGGRLQRLSRDPSSDFADEDMAAQLNGKPEDAFTYYREAFAERTRLEHVAEQQGRSTAGVDAALRKRAVAMIFNEPLRHLAATPLYLWRGALLWFPALALALAIGLRRRDYELCIFVLPALGMVMFYALLSHFILRYGLPASPIVIVCAVALAQVAVRHFFGRGSLRAARSVPA